MDNELNIGYLGYSTVTKNILDEISLDPELVISFRDEIEAEYGRGVSYEGYEPWIRVDTINSSEAVDAIEARDIDVLLVAGWPELLHEEALEAPNIGCVGRHLSLLPKRRGRAPVAWALIHGLDRTGVTFFWLDQGIDSGDILEQGVVEIDQTDHAEDLHQKCTQKSISLLNDKILPQFNKGNIDGEPQNHDAATYTHPRRPDMGIINWTDSAYKVHNFIRGQSHPYPGAFTYHQMDKVTCWRSEIGHEVLTKEAPGTILESGDDQDQWVVQCGEGTVVVTVEVTDEGDPLSVGDRLGAVPY